MRRPVLLLGDPRLHEPSRAIAEAGARLDRVRDDLRDTLLAYREAHGAGRGIAAPQIGVPVRVVYLHWPEPELLVDPRLDRFARETFDLWDDCMCFPELLVKVRRHRSCRLRYRDLAGRPRERIVEDDLAELVQHEVDHLDGILAVERAIDGRSFALRRQREAAE